MPLIITTSKVSTSQRLLKTTRLMTVMQQQMPHDSRPSASHAHHVTSQTTSHSILKVMMKRIELLPYRTRISAKNSSSGTPQLWMQTRPVQQHLQQAPRRQHQTSTTYSGSMYL